MQARKGELALKASQSRFFPANFKREMPDELQASIYSEMNNIVNEQLASLAEKEPLVTDVD
jgi:hypothetical protein